MNMKYIIIGIILFIFSSFNVKAQPQNKDIMMVYIGGSYQNYPGINQQRKACYWVNGYMEKLDGVAVQSLTTYKGRVYATGIYRQQGDKKTFCYWIDGMPYALPNCTSVNRIQVYNDNVYVSGYVNTEESGFWINGVRQNMFTDGLISDFKIINNKIYATGAYKTGEIFNACYWIDGKRFDLNNSQNYIGYGIEMVNNQIYIGAWGTVNNPNTSCYWINGIQKKNIVDNKYTIINEGFVIHNGNVIMLGEENYWVNGIKQNYKVIGFKGSVYTYVNGIIYIAGTYTGLGENEVCYWEEAERHKIFGLNGEGKYFILTSIHIAPFSLPE